MPVSLRARVRATLDFALTAALIALTIWAALFLSAERAHAQSALDWAAQGMDYTNRADGYKSGRRVVSNRFARRVLRAETRAGVLAGVSPALAAKAREISAACGSRVISGVRHTRIAGSHRWSLHASGRAVDMQGNPGCIYAHLRGWSGGYSTDYGRVRHVHISLGGREDGIRFSHRGGRTRLAWR